MKVFSIFKRKKAPNRKTQRRHEGPRRKEDIVTCYTPIEYIKAGRELERKSREKELRGN